jgi:Sec-independent protein secretion pathway component TatC
MSIESRRWVIVAGVVLAYFVLMPADLPAVLASAREVLSLTQSISPWLYMVVAAGIIARALVRCFGRSPDVTVR